MSLGINIKKPSLPGLATSSFTTGPKDEVAAVDVYALGEEINKSSDKVFTSVKDLDTSEFKNLYKLVNNPTELADFIKSAKTTGELQIDESSLMRRLTDASSDIKHGFTDLTQSVKNSAAFTLSKETKSKISCAIDDARVLVSASKIKDINGLASFFNKYTKTSTFKKQDTGAISGILSSVVAKTSELGIPDAYKSIAGNILDNEILQKVTKTLLPIAIAKGNPDLLRQLSYGPYGKVLNSFFPGATRALIGNFSLKGGSARPISTIDDLLGTIGRIDSAAGRAMRNGEEIFDVTEFLGGSRDFQRLLASSAAFFMDGAPRQNGKYPSAFTTIRTPKGHEIYAAYGLAGYYQKTTAAASVKKYFSKIALTGTYDMSLPRPAFTPRTMVQAPKRQTTDPRLLNHIFASAFM